MEAKAVQKRYKDAKNYVKHHAIELGDQVLLKQHQSKSNPPYDPAPYKVIQIQGHQITGERDDVVRTRDAQKWKVVHPRTKPNYESEQWAAENLSAEQLWTEPSTSTQSATEQATAGPPAATEPSSTAEELPAVAKEPSATQLSENQPLAPQTPATHLPATQGAPRGQPPVVHTTAATAGPPAAMEPSSTAEELPAVGEEQSVMQLPEYQPLAEQTPAAHLPAATTGAQTSTSQRQLRGGGRGRPPKSHRWNFHSKRK